MLAGQLFREVFSNLTNCNSLRFRKLALLIFDAVASLPLCLP